jgi:hypothetical protein
MCAPVVSRDLSAYLARRREDLQAAGGAGNAASTDAYAKAEFCSLMDTLAGVGDSLTATAADVSRSLVPKDMGAFLPAASTGHSPAAKPAQGAFHTEIHDALSVGSAWEAKQMSRHGAQASLDWRAATAVVTVDSANAGQAVFSNTSVSSPVASSVSNESGSPASNSTASQAGAPPQRA